MQIILTIGLALTLGFSLLQCENKTAQHKSEPAKTNTATPPNVQSNSPTVAAAATPEEAPRISLADAKKDFDAGNAVFVDTRSDATYKNEHIKGAINIPAADFQTRYAEVPKNKKIIAYCS